MPYYTGGPIGPNPDQVSLDDFRSSGLLSLKTAAENVWEGNPTHLGVDYLKFRSANDGTRLDKATAEQQVKQSGVKLDVPDSSYTPEALDMLIGRKQDEIRRADILARAPTGIVPTTTRFAAQLLTGLTDPLNIAAGFIPVVGEARYASMLARAGDSFIARSGARAVAGAAEGAVGVAALEPFAYAAHQQLQDDYHFTDSLMNVAFGAALGGALHTGAGAIGDLLRGGAPHPATRYGDMSVQDIQTVMNFERQRGEMPATDQARALETFTPEMRRALGAPEAPAPVAAAGLGAERAPFERSPMSAAEIHDRLSPEFKASAMRSAVADMLQGRMPDVENIVHMDPAAVPRDTGAAIDEMIGKLQDQKAELLGPAGELAEKGAIRTVKQELAEHVSQRPEATDENIKARAKEIQAEGGSYKSALAKASKEFAARINEHDATTARLQQIIDRNAKAQQAVQSIHEIDQQLAELAQHRQAADRTPTTVDQVRATVERQAAPEAVSVADFFSARAAEKQLAEAPKGDAGIAATTSESSAAVASAEADMVKAGERLEAVRKNLEQSGMTPEKLQAALDEMKPFDEARNDAKSLGDAAKAAALCGVRS